MRYVFPADYDERTCYLVPINASLIPLVAGALKHFEERRVWHDDDEHHRAYNAFAELQICMTKLCVDQLIESNNRLYRMLDTAIFGVGYEVQSVDPLVVLPDIPPQRTMGIYGDDSILGRMNTLQQLLDNALNGTATPQYDEPDGVRDLLRQLINRVSETGQLDDEILARLIEIAALLA